MWKAFPIITVADRSVLSLPEKLSALVLRTAAEQAGTKTIAAAAGKCDEADRTCRDS